MAVEETTIARPYAEAAYGWATRSGKLEPWSAMLQLLSAVVSDRKMVSLITSPKLSREKLEKILLEICGEHIPDEQGSNFIRLLNANERLLFAPTIACLYEQLKREAEGVVDVTVFSAYAVTEEEKSALGKALEQRLGKEINIATEEDPSLIGGIRVRAGDLVIDGSILGGLGQLANELGI